MLSTISSAALADRSAHTSSNIFSKQLRKKRKVPRLPINTSKEVIADRSNAGDFSKGFFYFCRMSLFDNARRIETSFQLLREPKGSLFFSQKDSILMFGFFLYAPMA